MANDFPLTRLGGRTNFDEGQLVMVADADNIGDFAQGSLLNVLALLLGDSEALQALDGFYGDSCQVTKDSATQVTVGKGVALRFDTTHTDAFSSPYKAIVLEADTVQAITAATSGNHRYDLVTLQENDTEDQAATRNIRDSLGNVSTSSVNHRLRWSATASVVAGTEVATGSTPAIPATPSGALAVALIYVTNADLTVFADLRVPLQPARTLREQAGHVRPHVETGIGAPGSSCLVEEMQVTELRVKVNAGQLWTQEGEFIRIPDTLLSIATADLTNPRIDLVAADRDGVVQVVTGTPAGSPVAPTLINSAPLAEVAVAALTTAITNANITDKRVTSAEWVGVPTSPVLASFTTGAEGDVLADAFDVAIASVDPEGNAVARTVRYRCDIIDTSAAVDTSSNWHLSEQGAGSEITTTAKPALIVDTDANGAATVRLLDSGGFASGTVYLRLTPLNTIGSPAIVALTFA